MLILGAFTTTICLSISNLDLILGARRYSSWQEPWFWFWPWVFFANKDCLLPLNQHTTANQRTAHVGQLMMKSKNWKDPWLNQIPHAFNSFQPSCQKTNRARSQKMLGKNNSSLLLMKWLGGQIKTTNRSLASRHKCPLRSPRTRTHQFSYLPQINKYATKFILGFNTCPPWWLPTPWWAWDNTSPTDPHFSLSWLELTKMSQKPSNLPKSTSWLYRCLAQVILSLLAQAHWYGKGSKNVFFGSHF